MLRSAISSCSKVYSLGELLHLSFKQPHEDSPPYMHSSMTYVTLGQGVQSGNQGGKLEESNEQH